MILFVPLFALAAFGAEYLIQPIGSNPNYGYLMYSDDKIFGHVCADDFYGQTAKLACEYFDYPGVTSFDRIPAADVSHTEHDIIMETNCGMEHTNFADCEVEIDDIECGSQKVVKLTCSTLSPTTYPTTESPTRKPSTLVEHVKDLEDKLKECIDTEEIEMPEGCITWLEYCNTYPDLKEAYCGGSDCATVVEESSCRNHFLAAGASQGRKCYDLPHGCDSWLMYCNTYSDLKDDYCGGSMCTTDAHAKRCRQHFITVRYTEPGRRCPWGNMDPVDPNDVIENTGVGGKGWGGLCTCPDGQKYEVGDNGDMCGSLACVGGISGQCIASPGPWSYRKVICAGAEEGATLESEFSNTLSLSALNASGDDTSFVNIMLYGFALIGCAYTLSFIHQKASGSTTFKPISNQNEDEI